ncbi:MAG: vitamin B12 dependent-methionine synthase activation domain-containing protein [Ignavibacteria bacterium]|jgi:5-methyltetrahydrofolate--homocysteine methyltransferase
MQKNNKCIYDPLSELMAYYSKEKTEKAVKTDKKEVSIEENLKARIIDGDKIGIEKDLDIALKKYSALEIINNILLDGMKVVGELFGSGQMQLPFVLQSAECMKTAVGYLEQFMEKAEGETSKGVMVLATVKGDVHDIGKNLVDIILTNNGYKVINLGIKCPLENILSAYNEHKADVIGMSGLLVKSTAIMKENLELMNERGYDFPVVLGGAALKKRFVEGDLRSMYIGDVYYANDAFDGLKYMEFILEHKKKGARPKLEIYIDPRIREKKQTEKKPESEIIKSEISTDNPVPKPPFWGSKAIENIPIEKVYEYINEVALFRGSWNVYKDRTKPDKEYDELIKNEIIPVFNELKLKAKREKLLIPKVIYGYFPCQSDGNDLIIYKPKNVGWNNLFDEWNNIDFEKLNFDVLEEWNRYTFPRQSTEKHLCISDFFKSKETGLFDVVSFQIVTVGKDASEYAQILYNENKYQEYLYFHGLSVETTEALAEYWHKVIRKELGIDKKDSTDIKKIFQQGYQGSRYSFGYPACPNLEDNKILFDILKPERIGVSLTEEWQMVPEQSTNAIICHHPEAKYFFIK